MRGNERTPLPKINQAAVLEFAHAYFASVGAHVAAIPEADYFGDSVEMANELLGLILAGTKTATAGAVADYEAEGVPIPRVGDLWIACDGEGEPRAMLRTTEIRIGPFDSVDEQFAWDEGEGDRSLDYWTRSHATYFERRLTSLDIKFHSKTSIVFERFEVVYSA